MKLSDLCFYVSEKIDVSNLNIDNYISTENILPNKMGVDKASNLPSIGTTSSYQKRDVLISNIRPYFKKIWYANKDGGCSNDVLVFRSKENVDTFFLYYVLSDNKFFDYSMSTAKGTKMPRGDKQSLMNYDVPDFDKNTQEKIGKLLRLLDSKIELNTQINNNLEQQAQALFDKYFSDNSNAIETTLGKVCKCELGGTPNRNKPEYWGGKIPWINSGEVNNFRIIKPSEYITEVGLEKSATKLLPKKTTVIAITGATLGQVSLLEISSCANQSVVGVLPNDDIPYEFVYPFVKSSIKELISHQTGGAQQHINKQNVEQLGVKLFSKSIMLEYKNKVKDIYQLISNNCFENDYLSQLRDALLPKLMSGEIDVSKVNVDDLTSADKLSFSKACIKIYIYEAKGWKFCFIYLFISELKISTKFPLGNL